MREEIQHGITLWIAAVGNKHSDQNWAMVRYIGIATRKLSTRLAFIGEFTCGCSSNTQNQSRDRLWMETYIWTSSRRSFRFSMGDQWGIKKQYS